MKETLRPLMFVGTGSDVGKSVVAAGFCRLFKEDGFRPAPFKAQNMSLNSFATPDGFEIGRAQAVQAEACGIAPRTEMNPILLKPTSHTVSQVVLNGKPYGNMSARAYFDGADKEALFAEVIQAFNRLQAEYSPIVIEGAGSISELNLKEKDITNMRVARQTGAATILVADIDRGGLFGSVYGTLALLSEEERACIVGVLVNKFRGDISLFYEGKKILEELTGKPVVGILPYMDDLFIEEEDSVELDAKETKAKPGKVNVCVVHTGHLSNFTDFRLLESLDAVNLYYSDEPPAISEADILILPGSKNTISDLIELRHKGIEEVVLSHHAKGKPLVGICGGYQMLGQEILDPEGIEGDVASAKGLGIFPTTTTLRTGKRTRQSSFLFTDGTAKGDGYEIHSGVTPTDTPVCTLDTGETDGYRLSASSWGTYLHGILDNASVVEKLLSPYLPGFRVPFDFKKKKEEGFDRLAEVIRREIDIDYIYSCLRK